MPQETGNQGRSRKLVLAAMVFAVAMTFIDQTIVTIAVPRIQGELGLSSTGIQWVVNGYLLSLAALFAFGGRLADTIGHRRMVILGVIVFTVASAMCGFTPKGSLAEGWLVAFRVLQGAGGAIMYPAALAIVINTFPLRERGRAVAIFFGVAGGLTAVGPILGGVLTEWTWRAIFWVNIPVAATALILIAVSKPVTERRPGKLDLPGAVLIAGGIGLSIFGLQQAILWGWLSLRTDLCIGGGLVILLCFVWFELRTETPLIDIRIFTLRPFLIDNVLLFLTMTVFISLFFFGSEYAQISLREPSAKAGIILLYFFIGFAVAAQVGGRLLDRVGVKRPVVIGCVLGAIGFSLWASHVTTLHLAPLQLPIILTGAGMGLAVGPLNTDAINRAGRLSYGEATGVTQTVRNFGSSLGLAVLGTELISVLRRRITTTLVRTTHVQRHSATQIAKVISEKARGGATGGGKLRIPHFLAVDFASAVSVVLHLMAGIMALAAVIALLGLRRGVQEELPSTEMAAEVTP